MTTPTSLRSRQLEKRRFAVLLTGAVLAAGSVGAHSAPLPISVSIAKKIAAIPAGAAPVWFDATVKNDVKNAGVKWSLTAAGVACSPGCGTLGAETATTVKYFPPGVLPASPKEAPTLTAKSVSDSTKSDSDSFKISAPLVISVTIVNKIVAIKASAAPVIVTARVVNDASNAGVTWTLTNQGGTCSVPCGTLTALTSTSARYTPPNSAPGLGDNEPTITATSVRNRTKGDADTFIINPSAITVTILNKANAVKAGSSGIKFTANVKNDRSNSGVVWGLSGYGGSPCNADCGTLSSITPTTVIYHPPATVLSPPEQVYLAATSARDLTMGDFDGFVAISGNVSSCVGTPTGHESLLNGRYTFFAQGQSPMAASFAADGKGHFADLGGGVAGSMDINVYGSPQSFTILPSASGGGFYTVGADPAKTGDVGCLSLSGSDGSVRIFRISLGQEIAGIATAGRITEYDDQYGNPVAVPQRLSGPLLRQDPTAFATGNTSHLQKNFAFGLSGSPSSLAGTLVLDPATGQITDSAFDSDDPEVPLVQKDVTGSKGSIKSVSAKTGRALFNFAPITQSWPEFITQTQGALYIVNANEFFLISLDPNLSSSLGGVPPWLYAGRAIASEPLFTSTSISGNAIYHGNGFAQASRPGVNLGLLTFKGGSLSGTVFNYDSTSGASMTSVAHESYTVSRATGRVELTGTGLTNPPVFYLAHPSADTETILGFAVGTDTHAASGLLEPGASSNLTTAHLAGNYFFGDDGIALDVTYVNRAGVMDIGSTGVLGGTQFGSTAPPGLLTETAIKGSVVINNASGPGTGNVGSRSVAITNGSKLFFIEEAAGTPASITTAEHR